jgi:hypothetical protein
MLYIDYAISPLCQPIAALTQHDFVPHHDIQILFHTMDRL